MRRTLTLIVMLTSTIGFATTAAAQRRQPRTIVPDEGMVAVGASIGVAVPSEISLAAGADLAAEVEDYLTPRVSIRGQLSRASFDTIGHSFNGTAHPIAFDGNVVYNWEGGAWHPYVTGGIGVYHYAFTENGLASGDTKVGVEPGWRRGVLRDRPRHGDRRVAPSRGAGPDDERAGDIPGALLGPHRRLQALLRRVAWRSGECRRPARGIARLGCPQRRGRGAFEKT